MAMARVVELTFTEEELAHLARVSRSRTEPVSHVKAALDDRPRSGTRADDHRRRADVRRLFGLPQAQRRGLSA
jgi:hypothetical protein